MGVKGSDNGVPFFSRPLHGQANFTNVERKAAASLYLVAKLQQREFVFSINKQATDFQASSSGRS